MKKAWRDEANSAVLLLVLAAGHAPKTVKLFINQPQTLDFDAAEKRKPVQELMYVILF